MCSFEVPAPSRGPRNGSKAFFCCRYELQYSFIRNTSERHCLWSFLGLNQFLDLHLYVQPCATHHHAQSKISGFTPFAALTLHRHDGCHVPLFRSPMSEAFFFCRRCRVAKATLAGSILTDCAACVPATVPFVF